MPIIDLDKFQDARVQEPTQPIAPINLEAFTLNRSQVEQNGEGAIPVEEGVISTMRLVTDPELEGVTGKYFTSDGTEVESSQATYDLDDQEKLWKMCEDYIGEKFSTIS